MLFDFLVRGVGVLPANSRAGHFARERVQIEGDFKPLLTRHGTVDFDLFREGSSGVMDCPLERFAPS